MRTLQDVVEVVFLRLKQLAGVLAAVAIELANSFPAKLRALLRHFAVIREIPWVEITVSETVSECSKRVSSDSGELIQIVVESFGKPLYLFER
jgi:hypothetical protein